MQIRSQSGIIIAKQDRADPAFAFRHQATAQVAICQGIAHRNVVATFAKLLCGHAQSLIRFAVVAATVGESGVEDRLRYRNAFRQGITQTASAPGLLPRFRGHARRGFEQTMEVIRAHRHLPRQFVERKW